MVLILDIIGIVKSIISSISVIAQFAISGSVIGLIKLYLKFCVISSTFISLFLLGGFITPLISIIYIYYVLYKKMKCWANNIPDNKCVI